MKPTNSCLGVPLYIWAQKAQWKPSVGGCKKALEAAGSLWARHVPIAVADSTQSHSPRCHLSPIQIFLLGRQTKQKIKKFYENGRWQWRRQQQRCGDLPSESILLRLQRSCRRCGRQLRRQDPALAIQVSCLVFFGWSVEACWFQLRILLIGLISYGAHGLRTCVQGVLLVSSLLFFFLPFMC